MSYSDLVYTDTVQKHMKFLRMIPVLKSFETEIQCNLNEVSTIYGSQDMN